MKQEDLKEFKCKEVEGCEGTQQRFLLSGVSKNNNIISQFQCKKCLNYVRIVNGVFESIGRYNNVEKGLV